MIYIDKSLYEALYKDYHQKNVPYYSIDKDGYKVLSSLIDVEAYKSEKTADRIPIQFTVTFRTLYSNLVFVRNSMFAVAVDDVVPQGAFTLDDLVFLHAKKFVDETLESEDMASVIRYSSIHPWGVLFTSHRVIIPIEIIMTEEPLEKGLLHVKSPVIWELYKTQQILRNGFNPITVVRNVYTNPNTFSHINKLVSDLSVYKLKVVSKNE